MAPSPKTTNHSGFVFVTTWTCIAITIFASHCDGAADAVYDDVSRLFDDKLGTNSSYKTTIRPVINQTKRIQVNASFKIIAIVEINAITQEFTLNGFLQLSWIDEILAWNPADYNDIRTISPEPVQIWRPRLVLLNTIKERDLFEDDYCPVITYSSGTTFWVPGSLFPASCKLNLYKYPFDEQECFITLHAMYWTDKEIVFNVNDDIGTWNFLESGEWTIVNTSMEVEEATVLQMKFQLRRLPGFFIVNIVIPIVLMSFLNILVFIIPVDSGEKISYGITVLLALTVFMSIVSEQLPRTSDPIPLVTIYLLVLTVISVCTVIVSIFIVYCHHREEKELKHQDAASSYKSLFHKFKILNRAAEGFSTVQVKPAKINRRLSNSSTGKSSDAYEEKKLRSSPPDAISNVLDELKENKRTFSDAPGREAEEEDDPDYVNRWKQIGKHIDFLSFITFTVIWISVTIGFLVEILWK